MADITNQINDARNVYGGSDLTDPKYTAASRSLNLSAASNSIINAQGPTITTVPFTLEYQDSIGLFGAENYYVKINLDIIDTGNTYTVVNDYAGMSTSNDVALFNTYLTAFEDDTQDLGPVNDFEPAVRGAGFADLVEPIVSLQIINDGTGNIYNDWHLDARLYNSNREEITDEEHLIDSKGEFYLGIHARNSRRLPYKVRVVIGETDKLRSELTPEEDREILP